MSERRNRADTSPSYTDRRSVDSNQEYTRTPEALDRTGTSLSHGDASTPSVINCPNNLNNLRTRTFPGLIGIIYIYIYIMYI